MFIEKYLEPLLNPFRKLYSKFLGVKNIKGGIQGDMSRLKRLGGNVKDQAGAAAGKVKGAAGKAKAAGEQAKGAAAQAQGAAAQAKGQASAAGVAVPGAAAAGGAPAASGPPPAKAKKMGLFSKKNVCPTCGQQQQKDWDQCPFCAQAEAPAAAAPAAAPQKTVAFMVGAPGAQSMQVLGWLVVLDGVQRGDLFTLKPMSAIGSDPSCEVVINGQGMSRRHAIIKVQNNAFVLEDPGSTNGTFVNDQRVSKHELVDNDFIKFGQTLVKFKSL